MIFRHLSRQEAERYRDTRPYAMISITDPRYPQARLEDDPHRVGLLRLQFHDVGLLVGPEADAFVLPAAEHARAIVQFFRVMEPRIDKLIVHCEAGISRSAGVGSGLALCLRQSDAQFYIQSRPNPRVRRLILEAWKETA
jgi:predicted protein tyrosine phosphatase